MRRQDSATLNALHCFMANLCECDSVHGGNLAKGKSPAICESGWLPVIRFDTLCDAPGTYLAGRTL